MSVSASYACASRGLAACDVRSGVGAGAAQRAFVKRTHASGHWSIVPKRRTHGKANRRARDVAPLHAPRSGTDYRYVLLCAGRRAPRSDVAATPTWEPSAEARARWFTPYRRDPATTPAGTTARAACTLSMCSAPLPKPVKVACAAGRGSSQVAATCAPLFRRPTAPARWGPRRHRSHRPRKTAARRQSGR